MQIHLQNNMVLFLIFLCFGIMACGEESKSTQTGTTTESNLPLDNIQLPAGFKIEIYAEGVENARSMALSPSGVLYVGTRNEGKVYALLDEDKDQRAEKVLVLAEGLKMPNGVAFKDGTLYVAEVNRLIKFENIEQQLTAKPTYKVVYDKYPSDTWHGWKYIAFGPDGKLYIPVGAPCNVCERKNKMYASITRINPDGTGLEVYAHGVRNTVGFDWHPDTDELWFTDNGRDRMGDDIPGDELNRVQNAGQHYGFPYCHAGSIADPEFGKKKACSDFVAPAKVLGAHVAALGMEFYTAGQFPEEYQKQIFIAEHGSWNRSSKVGYQVSLITLQGNQVTDYKPFAQGWLQGQQAWGRPVDIELMPDGSMLVSDDFAGVIYRIYYEG
ncbi:sorbosone dehydrogenase family protein [Rapidithrix thailandica]|uniref:Sorbosone dehydrogenase family protein n=1 Tax=Rapidithrix thailandica TaxID=413964 RepID=A0AAW9S6D0_9BACT